MGLIRDKRANVFGFDDQAFRSEIGFVECNLLARMFVQMLAGGL